MLHKIKEIWLVIFHTLFGSVRRWQHMLRYTSESLESNLWCLLNLNFNTGNPAQFSSVKSFIYLFYTWWLYHIANPLTCFCCIFSLYWTSQTQTVQPTAKQPSCTRKTSGSTRRGFLLLLNRVGVTVDPCYCSSMNSVQPGIKKPPIKKTTDLTEIKMTHLKIFLSIFVP